MGVRLLRVLTTLSLCLCWLPSLAEMVLACRRQATGWGRRTHNQPYVFSEKHGGPVYYVQMAQRPHLLTFGLRFSSCTTVHYACIIYCDLYLFLRNIFFSFALFYFYCLERWRFIFFFFNNFLQRKREGKQN